MRGRSGHSYSGVDVKRSRFSFFSTCAALFRTGGVTVTASLVLSTAWMTPAGGATPVPTIETVAVWSVPQFISDVVVEESGSVLLVDPAGVWRWEPSTDVTTPVARAEGCPDLNLEPPPYDGELCNLVAAAVDPTDGGVYYRSISAGVIEKNGTVVVGNGCTSGCSLGDGGLATEATICCTPWSFPRFSTYDMAVAPNGDLYLADGFRVRRVDGDGIITTIAGTGVEGHSGDGGPAVAAEIGLPLDLEVGADGSVYVATFRNRSADPDETRVRRIDPSGVITTVAGSVQGFAGDGGQATDARLLNPMSIAVDPLGGIYILDRDSEFARVRYLDPSGVIDTVAGSGPIGYSGDGGPATDAQLMTADITLDPMSGALYLAESCECPTPPPAQLGLRRMSTPGALSGTVRASGSGDPAGGVTVTLMAWPSWTPVGSTTTGPDGSYRFDPVAPGRYRVRYFDGQGRFARQWNHTRTTFKGADDVVVTVGDEAVVDEALAPIAGLLTGVVRDSGGVPLPGAWVQVFDGTGYVASKVTGPNGGYFLNGLPPGDYLVRAVHPDGGATWHPGTTHGGSTPVTISTGTTYGHITFP
jgi:hypothetical protein